MERSTTSNPSSVHAAVLVRALALVVDRDRVRGDRVGDVRPLRVDVHRVGLADVAGQADLDRVLRVGHVDDLEPALRRLLDPEHALVVAAPLRVGGVEHDLGVAAVGGEHVGVQEGVALGGRLHVVLEAERRGRVAHARGGGVEGDDLGIDGVALGELDEGLAAGVGPDGQRADRGEHGAALGEEVEVGVRVAREQRGHELPLGALAAALRPRREAACRVPRSGSGGRTSRARPPGQAGPARPEGKSGQRDLRIGSRNPTLSPVFSTHVLAAQGFLLGARRLPGPRPRRAGRCAAPQRGHDHDRRPDRRVPAGHAEGAAPAGRARARRSSGASCRSRSAAPRARPS